ncbi:hypothetical protein RGR602_PC00603 (plasmid) [Rhizobium gallicum bv. gallicum R602sp]|uniref:Uncharacterized protein n=1 Tax=Rhizobium gallicum bv. gallicum R602sp TaxID=1041138 RepID=A0A0B4XDQ4_9HYPH|nr:hypothetical protein RGR602_PC00603 [Rhizobium gallicum bv. gallicum R602sp]
MSFPFVKGELAGRGVGSSGFYRPMRIGGPEFRIASNGAHLQAAALRSRIDAIQASLKERANGNRRKNSGPYAADA